MPLRLPLQHPPQQQQQQQQQQQELPPPPAAANTLIPPNPPALPCAAPLKLDDLRPAPLRQAARAGSTSSSATRPARRPHSVRNTSDYLTVRMANPYTGVVSPSVVGEEEDGEEGVEEGVEEVERHLKEAEVIERAKPDTAVPLPLFSGRRTETNGIVLRRRGKSQSTGPEEDAGISAGAEAVEETAESVRRVDMPGTELQLSRLQRGFGMFGWERPVVQRTPVTVEAALALKYPDLSPRRESGGNDGSASRIQLRNHLRMRGKDGEMKPGLSRFVGGRLKDVREIEGSETGDSTSRQSSRSQTLVVPSEERRAGIVDGQNRQAQDVLAYWVVQESLGGRDRTASTSNRQMTRPNNFAMPRAAGPMNAERNLQERVASSPANPLVVPCRRPVAGTNLAPRRPQSTLERSWTVIGRSWAAIAQRARLTNVDLRRLPTVRLIPPAFASLPKDRITKLGPTRPGAREDPFSNDGARLSLERGSALAFASFDIMFYRMIASGVSYLTSLLLGNKFLKTLLDASTPPEAVNAVFELFRFLFTPFRIIFAPLRFLFGS